MMARLVVLLWPKQPNRGTLHSYCQLLALISICSQLHVQTLTQTHKYDLPKFTSRTSMQSTRLNSCLRYNHIVAVSASNTVNASYRCLATERGPFTSNLPADLGKRTLWKLDLSYLVNGSSRIKKIGCTVSRLWYDAEVIINHAMTKKYCRLYQWIYN